MSAILQRNLKNTFVSLKVLLLFFFLMPVNSACAALEDDLGGHVEAVVDGKTILFPTLKTDIQADVKGDLATVTLTQTFNNPTRKPLNATYLFPLNHQSAVYSMIMQTGNRTIRAVIKKKEDAQKTFEKAKQEGKSAALLTQQRPNMFTQQVANLMPGQPIKITLQYVQTVPKVDGEYELEVPLVAGPRYTPKSSLTAPLPEYPPVLGLNLPKTLEDERVSIQVRLENATPVQAVFSKTHAITVQSTDNLHRLIHLTQGHGIDNRDFILHYRLAGSTVQAGFLNHQDKRGKFFSLLLEPPAAPAISDITPREMDFLIDTSGSMEGLPLSASKTFMREALAHLKRNDTFRIIHFSNEAGEFAAQPLPATAENIRRGVDFVNDLYADGGTEVETGIRCALEVPHAKNALRTVVFLTDGYIGNEPEIMALLQKDLGDARLYAFGVGTSVNRYLLDEMATIGRGFTRYIDPTEDPDAAAKDLARKLEAPILTDISIDWGDLGTTDVYPKRIPDLFAGDSLRIMGKFKNGSSASDLVVYGKVNGQRSQLPVHVVLADSAPHNGEAIPLIWARTQIAELMRNYHASGYSNALNLTTEQIQDKVTQLGLSYAMVTDWTSFVAVSDQVVNAHPDGSVDASVPLPMVEGDTPAAYGETFSGASTPEPHELAMFALLLSVLGLAGWQQRRKMRLIGSTEQ